MNTPMILSPQALASMVKMALDQGLAPHIKGFSFQPTKVTLQIRQDPKVPGGIAIHASGVFHPADPTAITDLQSRAVDWLSSGDTGASSQTIFHVMMGTPHHLGSSWNWPHDNSDLGRCIRLLDRFPEWRERLPEMAKAFPQWGPMVEAWPELEKMYREDHPDHKGRSDRLYERMHEISQKCYAIKTEGD